jgi:Xaa-Pro aminopeptidase
MIKRLHKLRKTLHVSELIPYLVTDLNNIRYLTGFTGSYARLLVTDDYSYLISDSRYEEYAISILPSSVKFVLQKGDANETLKELCRGLGLKRLCLEDHMLPLSALLEMKKHLRGVSLIPGGSEVNTLRMVKDEGEIEILRQAARITDRCVDHIMTIVKPGVLEWDIAVEIEYFYRKNGCRKTSFDSIVASGAGTSMPHYETGMRKKVAPGDALMVDMGCEFRGYNSDLTRTFFVHSIDPELEKIYMIVKEAQERAVEAVRPGITTGRLDEVARGYIAEKGFGDNFGHSLGHGFGIEVHELPAIRKNGSLRLKKNMTITIEPGIYIPGKGGVRIEDMVLVTAMGKEVLTRSTKEIILL